MFIKRLYLCLLAENGERDEETNGQTKDTPWGYSTIFSLQLITLKMAMAYYKIRK